MQFQVLAILVEEKLKVAAATSDLMARPTINDWIDIGIYGKDEKGKDKLIYLKKHKITEKESSYAIPVREKPRKAGIDPLHKLIDRHSSDNTKTLVRKKQ